jgi:hypothetical protein
MIRRFQKKPQREQFFPESCIFSDENNPGYVSWLSSVQYRNCSGDGVCRICKDDSFLLYTEFVYAKGECNCDASHYEECICKKYCQCRGSKKCPHCEAGEPIHDVFNEKKREQSVFASAGGGQSVIASVGGGQSVIASVGGGQSVLASVGGGQSVLASTRKKYTLVLVDKISLDFFFQKVEMHRLMGKESFRRFCKNKPTCRQPVRMEATVQEEDNLFTVVGLKCKAKLRDAYMNHLKGMEILFIVCSDEDRIYNNFSGRYREIENPNDARQPGQQKWRKYGFFAELELNERIFNPPR